ncbi:MAG TPA: redoxin family protein, partial [Polyangiaceae bacterium]|nr:redoxin family protein [Polyangiaceae bacterium]
MNAHSATAPLVRFGARIAFALVPFVALTACGRNTSAPASTTSPPASSPADLGATNTTGASVGGQDAASVGKPAPDFSLRDLDGKSVSLHEYRGKTVVLEWFNPGCPFVRASHTKASLKS